MNTMFVRFFVFCIILDKKIYPNLLYHAFYCGERFIRCKDCDRLFVVNSKDNQTIRCKECQHKKQLEYQRNSMKKSRNR